MQSWSGVALACVSVRCACGGSLVRALREAAGGGGQEGRCGERSFVYNAGTCMQLHYASLRARHSKRRVQLGARVRGVHRGGCGVVG